MALIQRSGKWGVQVYREGTREWVGTFPSYREAKEAEREALAKAPAKGRETVAEFCARYLDDFNYGGDRWTTESERNLSYALTRFVERFGKERMARFPIAEALPWASRQPESVVRAVRALFNDAIRSEVAPSNPFARLGLERSRGRADIAPLTEEELHMLSEIALARCGDFGKTMQAFVLFQGYVGCRPKEAFNLRHHDIDWERHTIYVAPSKNGKQRTILLPPQPARALSELPENDSEWLFASPQGRKLTKTSISYWWNKIRGTFETKLDPRRAAELRNSRPRQTDLTLYELRHCAATLFLERGVSPEDTAWQLGHTDGGHLVRTLYGHPSEAGRMSRVREAFEMEAANG